MPEHSKSPPGGRSPDFNLSDSIRRASENVGEFELPKAVEAAQRITAGIEGLKTENAGLQTTLSEQRTYIQELEDTAGTDYATQIPDKQSWDTEFAARLASGNILGIAVIDLANFKAVNDNKGGHLVGDAALLATADMLLLHGTRGDDFVARIGGDEFGILLDRAAREDGDMSDEDRLERFRTNMTDKIGTYAEHTTFDEVGYGASIGIAPYHPGDTQKELFQVAEADMYARKALWHKEHGQHRPAS